jgi:hypothetical protein
VFFDEVYNMGSKAEHEKDKKEEHRDGGVHGEQDEIEQTGLESKY